MRRFGPQQPRSIKKKKKIEKKRKIIDYQKFTTMTRESKETKKNEIETAASRIWTRLVDSIALRQ